MSRMVFDSFYYVTDHKGVRGEPKGVKMPARMAGLAKEVRGSVCDAALECIAGDENVEGIYSYLGFSIGQAIVEEVQYAD